MTYTERVFTLLRRHRFQWVRAEALMRVGGICSWRTRVSEARHVFQAPIQNRLRKIGKRTISEYRLGRRSAA